MEWSGSAPVAAIGSLSAIAASSNDTLCFRRFERAFSGSHSNFISVLIYFILGNIVNSYCTTVKIILRECIVGIIGPNGAGKTTLFRMITGQEKPDTGTFRIGETVKLAYVDQSRNDLDPNKTIWEVITDGLEVVPLGKRQINSRVYVARFNFSGSDQQKKVSMLSGGERNRVHLSRMLKEEANVLLLDQPIVLSTGT